MKNKKRQLRSSYMIKSMFFFVILSLLLVACSQAPGSQLSLQPTDGGPVPGSYPKAISVAKSLLANQYQINEKQIDVLQYDPVQWPDSCLGIPQPGMMCAMHDVDGYKILLSANDQTYEIRTNLDGSQVMLIPGPIPATPGMSITNMNTDTCWAVLFSSSEEAAFGDCGETFDQGFLDDSIQFGELTHFLTTYSSFVLDSPDGFLNFYGRGTTEPTNAEQRSILKWAQLAAEEVITGAPTEDAGLVINWRREGGFAGFCDGLSLYATGVVVATSCKKDDVQILGQSWLGANQLAQLFQWIDDFTPFKYDPQSLGTADAITVMLNFNGNGVTSASDNQQQKIADFAGNLYTQISQRNAGLRP